MNTQTGYEVGIKSAWNHFTETGHLRNVMQHYGNEKGSEIVRTNMHNEIEKAKKDKNHPLHFNNAHPDMFGKGSKGKTKADTDDYYAEMHRAVDSIHGMVSQSTHLHDAVNNGHILASLGKAKGKLSDIWKKHGAKDSTSKADIALVDKKHVDEKGNLSPKAEGAGINVSLKKGEGAQLGASSINEVSAIHEHALNKMLETEPEYAGLSEEKKEAHRQDLLAKLEEAKKHSKELSQMDYLEKDSKETTTPARKKTIDAVNAKFEKKRNKIAEIFSSIHDAHPKLKNHVIMESVTGRGKFGEKSVSTANFMMETPTFDANNKMISPTKIRHHSELTPHDGCRLEVSHKTDSSDETTRIKGQTYFKRKPRADAAVVRIRPAKGGDYFR